MDHVAIMQKQYNFLPKILSQQKSIESRWYKNKKKPLGCIKENEYIYFKNSGEPITVKARVDSILTFSRLSQETIHEILCSYHAKIGIADSDICDFYQKIKDKYYCILIFLKDPEITEPFRINKNGFGSMSAWISLPDINTIKVGLF